MINKQINMELYASYVYLSMTAFFSRSYVMIKKVLWKSRLSWFGIFTNSFLASTHLNRDDVALHGFVKRFKMASDEEREHAQKLIEYQVHLYCLYFQLRCIRSSTSHTLSYSLSMMSWSYWLMLLNHSLALLGDPWWTCQAAWDLTTYHWWLGNSSWSNPGVIGHWWVDKHSPLADCRPRWSWKRLWMLHCLTSTKWQEDMAMPTLLTFWRRTFLESRQAKCLDGSHLLWRWRASKRLGIWWRRWRGVEMVLGCMSLTRSCKPKIELSLQPS